MDPSAGEAWVAGRHIVREAETIKEHIGYMSQRFGLYPDLTVMENIDFYADIYSEPRRGRQEKIERLLAFSNLTPFKRRLAGNLSGGMKQKLGLACALIHTPKVLFLDEPTNGVDPGLAPRFLADPLPTAAGEGDDLRLHGLSRRGRALQPRGPDPPRPAAGLRHARRSEAADARHDPGNPRRRARGRPRPCSSERLPAGVGRAVRRPRARGEHASPSGPPPRRKRRWPQAGLAVIGIRPIEPSLEDVFVSVLAEKEPRSMQIELTEHATAWRSGDDASSARRASA